ncbi:YceD family protein [Thalassolituus sp. LLYu03]|uniref:YceD family protein n=1 Tax=Thalassolituus sp. LLYu03 TaxID=3421656 RepID=UPI003D287100
MAEAQLPKRIDAVKLVDNNQRLNASIDGSLLDRLSDAVENCVAPVHCEIHFSRDQDNNRLMTGSCHTQVVMICQRCLGNVTVPVDSSFELGLVFDDDQARQLPRKLEPVELDEQGQLDLWTVMEDEVLLALPPFPVHEHGECELKQPEPEPETEESDVKRPNPFGVLAKLKQ